MVVGPAYGVMVGLKPSAVAGAEQRKGFTEGPRQQLSRWAHALMGRGQRTLLSGRDRMTSLTIQARRRRRVRG